MPSSKVSSVNLFSRGTLELEAPGAVRLTEKARRATNPGKENRPREPLPPRTNFCSGGDPTRARKTALGNPLPPEQTAALGETLRGLPKGQPHGARAHGARAQGARAQGARAQGAQSPRGQSPRGQSPRGQSPRGQSPRGQSPRGQSPRGQSPRGQSPTGQDPERASRWNSKWRTVDYSKWQPVDYSKWRQANYSKWRTAKLFKMAPS